MADSKKESLWASITPTGRYSLTYFMLSNPELCTPCRSPKLVGRSPKLHVVGTQTCHTVTESRKKRQF